MEMIKSNLPKKWDNVNIITKIITKKRSYD